MLRFAFVLAAASLLALSSCSDNKVKTADDKAGSSVHISIDSDDSKTASATARTIPGDSDGNKFELSLPGGIEAKVKLPERLSEGGKFDIDGVGLYPGAKVRSVKVNASNAGTKRAVVEIGFSAPGDAAAVADWYQQQFDAKSMKVTRSGETLSGKNDDGNDFTIALTSSGAGTAKGLVTIIDADKG
ncbi:MAG: hypothetical protein H7267_09780 [Sandarakinorhabdus sp.]|nr:hypothetical protein [Sandarakinorhabdus sp.]